MSVCWGGWVWARGVVFFILSVGSGLGIGEGVVSSFMVGAGVGSLLVGHGVSAT